VAIFVEKDRKNRWGISKNSKQVGSRKVADMKSIWNKKLRNFVILMVEPKFDPATLPPSTFPGIS
jgi:hypothetical protein